VRIGPNFMVTSSNVGCHSVEVEGAGANPVVTAKRTPVKTNATGREAVLDMIRTYTMRLKTTKNQGETLTGLLSQLCELYNMALQQRIDVWKSDKKSISYYDQQKQLTELRGGVDEYAVFPLKVQRDPLRRLDRAFQAFFRRMKSGDRPGFPRFRSRDRYESFNVDKDNFTYGDNVLRIVKMGVFRTKTKCKIKGTPLELRVKRCGSKWQAQLVCDIGPAPDKVVVCKATGIDLGLTSLATLSNGREIKNPRWKKREEHRLSDADRNLSRKVRGSKNRQKSKEYLRRVHQRIVGLRASYLTTVAQRLVYEYDLIAHENLNVTRLVKSGFGKSILDAAWGQLIGKLNCEAEKAGKWVIPVNPRGTTQLCSGCGEKVPKKIWDRNHDCPKCGLSLGRDHNAALNILSLGVSDAERQNRMLEVSI
jgi:putative transposase